MSELTRYDAMTNITKMPNSHAMGVMKLIDSYYPAFAKKIFQKNPLMEKIVMANFSTMDILIYPICGKCEALAAYCRYQQNPDGTNVFDKEGKKVGVCRCLKCGSETIGPITFYDWCLMELKKKAPKDIESELIFAVDVVAERAMQDAKRIYVQAKEREKFYVESK